MKHNTLRIGMLVLIFSFFCSLVLRSQVTVGSALPPNKGALLDLKENSNAEVNATKGLLLPRVALEHPELINPLLDHDNAEDEAKMAHIGLTVFNVTDVIIE